MKLSYSLLAYVVAILLISLLTQTGAVLLQGDQILSGINSSGLAQVVSRPPVQPADPASGCTGKHKMWIPIPTGPGSPGVCVTDFADPGETLDKNLQDGHVKACAPASDGTPACVDIYYKCTKDSNGKFGNCKINVLVLGYSLGKSECTIKPPFNPNINTPGTVYQIDCKGGIYVHLCFTIKEGKPNLVECPKEIVVPQ